MIDLPNVREMLRKGRIRELAWLIGHPESSLVQLELKLAEGWSIEHKDGNRENYDPDNLVLTKEPLLVLKEEEIQGPGTAYAQSASSGIMYDAAARCFARMAEMFPEMAMQATTDPKPLKFEVPQNADSS